MGDRWKTLAAPNTFIWGELEKAGPPEEAEAVAAQNPRIRVTRVPDAGHVPWFDNPIHWKRTQARWSELKRPPKAIHGNKD